MKLLPIKIGEGIKYMPKEDGLVSKYFYSISLVVVFCAEKTKKRLRKILSL